MAADLMSLRGKAVAAKRLGWNEYLDPEQEFDLEPYNLDGEYADDGLAGDLEIVTSMPDELGPLAIYLVGGQEADPDSIEPLAALNALLANFSPTQPRDKTGKWTTGAAGHAGVVAKVKAAGAALGHLEHVAKAYVTDKIAAGVAKLPASAQAAVNGTFYTLKLGTAAAFVTWTTGQALAERVAKERGATPEQARRLRGVLATLDVTSFKPLSIGLGATGVGAATIGVISLVPPATAMYLAYATARSPLATARAARGMVKDVIAGTVGRVKAKLTGNAAVDNAETIAAALTRHNWDDWYIALFSAALDETHDVLTALGVADEAWTLDPPDIVPQDDDADAVLGEGHGDAFADDDTEETQ